MTHPLASDTCDDALRREAERIGQLEPVQAVLRLMRQTTGMRVALVARVTPRAWLACAVHDEAGLGLRPGDRLDREVTY